MNRFFRVDTFIRKRGRAAGHPTERSVRKQTERTRNPRPPRLISRLRWSLTTDGEAEPTWTQNVSSEVLQQQTGHTEALLGEEKRADFTVTFSNSFWDGVIVPIPVIKTSLYMCQSCCFPLLVFASAQGLRSISTLQTNFPISAYIHI